MKKIKSLENNKSKTIPRYVKALIIKIPNTKGGVK